MSQTSARQTPQESTPTDAELSLEQEAENLPDTPTWFARRYGEASEQDLASRYRNARADAPITPPPLVAGQAEAYEAYRKRLEQRFSMAQHAADPAFQNNRKTEPEADATARTQAFPERPAYGSVKAEARPKPRKARARVGGARPATIAIMTLTACCIGGAVGFFAANPDVAANLASSGMAKARSLFVDGPVAERETVITKKPVRMAKLDVKDASGAINTPIPLDIAAIPSADDMKVALRISGLPPSAYLTKGVEISSGEWMVKAEDVGKASLVVPHAATPELSLEVAALEEQSGEPAAPSQGLKVALDLAAVPVPGVPKAEEAVMKIEPANALPDQGFNKTALAAPPAPAPVPLPIESLDPEVRSLISKGDTLLKQGDLLTARQFYLRAYDLKAPTAAFGVGQTYDPAVYVSHKIAGLKPDIKLASEWYGKAAAAGHAEAGEALARLPAQP